MCIPLPLAAATSTHFVTYVFPYLNKQMQTLVSVLYKIVIFTGCSGYYEILVILIVI